MEKLQQSYIEESFCTLVAIGFSHPMTTILHRNKWCIDSSTWCIDSSQDSEQE